MMERVLLLKKVLNVGTNSNSGGSYYYSNANGSYYYCNDNGSTYYNPGPSGAGQITYTPPPSYRGAQK